MRVVGYISSFKTEKNDRLADVASQKERIESFCRKNNLELVKLYEEFQGKDDFKPALMKLINDASTDAFSKVIVLKIGNFGQDNVVKTWISAELKKYKVEIISLTEQAIKNNPAKSIKYKVRDIPSLPEVVTRVMELVQNPNSSASELSKVISHDTGLTSRVLRLVNSAYYGFPKQISSIQHAITILGFTTIRGLVLSSSIFKIFSQKNDAVKILDYKKLWKHSLVTAIAAKRINQFLQMPEEDDLFSAAILHDIGKIILDQYDHENYICALQEAIPFLGGRILDSEKKHCGVTHPEIGYIVAEEWNLPLGLSTVINYHHNPLTTLDFKMLTSVVYLGDIIAHILLDSIKFDINMFDENVLDYLALNQEDLETINSEMAIEIEDIGDLESFLR